MAASPRMSPGSELEYSGLKTRARTAPPVRTRFRRKDLDPFAFAGLWEFWHMGGKEIVSAAIIVGAPNPLVEPVHDRVPVILAPEGYHRWLDPEASAEELKALLKPARKAGLNSSR